MTLAPDPAVVGHDDGFSKPVARGPLSRRYDVALLDLDGVVYRGPDPIAGAAESLEQARAGGMRFGFVTNNASRTPGQVAAHLVDLGVPAAPAEVVTSAQAAAALSVERFGIGRRVFVVGSDGLRAAVADAGQILVDSYLADPSPEIVVQGFSPDLRYEDLAQATFVVAAGAHWVATNTDTTLPTARGIQPGNGTLVAVVAAATGRSPLVAGKPERALVDEAVKRTAASRPLMVGDRLDTDIEGAVRTGMDSLLVLTGISTVQELLSADASLRPTFLAADLSGLNADLTPLAEVGSLPEQRRSGWRAEVREGAVVLTRDGGAGDPMDAVRTLVVAAWRVLDAGATLTSITVDADQVSALGELGLPSQLLRAADSRSPHGGDAHAGQ